MASLSFPVRLMLDELGAAALDEAAANLATAADTATFLSALENNHQVWRALTEVARHQSWPNPQPHQTEYVIAISRKCGQGVCDEDVETLIGIDSQVARHLAGNRDLYRLRQRADLAWHEAENSLGRSFLAWLIDELDRKAHGAKWRATNPPEPRRPTGPAPTSTPTPPL